MDHRHSDRHGPDPAGLVALLQLASPALPIGGFSYSQGLEAAIDAGVVGDAATAARWIAAGLDVLSRGEAVLLVRQWQAWTEGDLAAVVQNNRTLLALRETAELRLETEQMGASLARLAGELQWGEAAARSHLLSMQPVALPTAYAYAASALRVDGQACAAAWLYGWTENQVAAALKAVPLGQVAGQRILDGLRTGIAHAASHAVRAAHAQAAAHVAQDAATQPCTGEDRPRADDGLSTFAPMLAILSSRHETQYSRLFRS